MNTPPSRRRSILFVAAVVGLLVVVGITGLPDPFTGQQIDVPASAGVFVGVAIARWWLRRTK